MKYTRSIAVRAVGTRAGGDDWGRRQKAFSPARPPSVFTTLTHTYNVQYTLFSIMYIILFIKTSETHVPVARRRLCFLSRARAHHHHHHHFPVLIVDRTYVYMCVKTEGNEMGKNANCINVPGRRRAREEIIYIYKKKKCQISN